MKKIILSETQVDKLIGKMVSEQFTPNKRYVQEVRCGFRYDGLKFHDDEIESISNVNFKVSFTIDIEHSESGIERMKIGNVWGPEEIKIDVTVYPEGSDDTETYQSVRLKPNWYKVKVENNADIGWIGIDQDIEMELIGDGGDIYVGEIVVHSKEI